MPRKAQLPSTADTNAAPGGVGAVDKALSLLAAFGDGDASLSLTELAQRTQLYKSAVLRLAASLEHAGLLQRMAATTTVSRREARWRLGPALARLHRVYAHAFPEAHWIQDALRALVKATGESAAYHVVQGRGPHARRLCLQREDSPQAVRHIVKAGDLLPLDRGTGGQVLSAFTPGLSSRASGEQHALYERVRAQGFAAGVGAHLPDVAGISAPVYGPSGAVVGALTLTMPRHRYNEHWIAPVCDEAARLSRQLAASA